MSKSEGKKQAIADRLAGKFCMYSGAPLHVWARLLREHGFPAAEFRARLIRSLVLSSLFGPFRLLERPLYMVRVPPLSQPPIFILGHWRSGSTHLHNLMSCDPALSWVNRIQAFVPSAFMTSPWWLRPLRLMGGPNRHRTQDHVKISADTPAEEEHAIAAQSHRSFSHWYAFPQDAPYLWHRYATLDALSLRELRRWERLYAEILRKAAWASGGKRLVLKSPMNTVRIPHLLRLFPEARFIHIVRNPYTLYPSLMKLHRVTLENGCLMKFDLDRVRKEAEDRYVGLMQKYLQDRSLIADERLIEVRYEDLSGDPLPQLERIYAHLGLPGWDDARTQMVSYLESIKDYRKNVYPADPAVIERVNRRWGFAVEHWGYEPS